MYKHEQKSNAKDLSKFTLTDHFKLFHQQIITKTQGTPFHFDSSSTIKHSPDNAIGKNINVEDIEGLRKALKNTT